MVQYLPGSTVQVMRSLRPLSCAALVWDIRTEMQGAVDATWQFRRSWMSLLVPPSLRYSYSFQAVEGFVMHGPPVRDDRSNPPNLMETGSYFFSTKVLVLYSCHVRVCQPVVDEVRGADALDGFDLLQVI